MIIYADVVLLVNFLFNAEVLILVYKLQSRKIRLMRLLPAALLGGGLGLAVFVPYLQPFLSATARYLVPFLMSAMCFFPCNFKSVVLGGVFIFVMSFLFSGIVNFFGAEGVMGFFSVIPFALFFDKLRVKAGRRHKDTVLQYRGRSVTVRGFCDSGNVLMYKGMPVIVACKEVFELLFGRGFNIAAVNEWIDETELRYIPYSALGKNGVIPGIVIDNALVEGRNFDNVILGYAGRDFPEKVVLNSIMI